MKAHRTGALWATTCHYCGSKATTEDHIVPRYLLPKPMSLVPYWFRAYNVVPCCWPCNQKKAHWRSDCECEACMWAWKYARAIFIPMVRPKFDYDTYPIVSIVRSPG